MNDSSTSLERAPRSGRMKKIAIGLGAALALLVLFVVMLPTMISWGLFRGTITGQLSGRMNGTVSIGGIVLGWSGPLQVKQLKINDPDSNSSLEVSVDLDQGLWALLTEGTGTLTGTVSGAVATRMDEDGTLSITRMIKPDPSGSAAAGTDGAGGVKDRPDGAKPSGPASIVPAGMSASFKIAALDLKIDDHGGKPYAAVSQVTGVLDVHAGGKTALVLNGGAQYLDNKGSFSLDASSDGIIAADGTLKWKGVPASVKAGATNLQFSAGGTRVAIESATVTVASTDLTGASEINAAIVGTVEGTKPSSLNAQVTIDKTMTESGAPVIDLAGVRGSVDAVNIPTSPLQAFLAETPVVLVRDVGPTVDFSAKFADASGKGMQMTLKSAQLALAAEGSVNADTRAAMLSRVTLTASVHPALAALAGMTVSAPAAVTLTATDVVVPASDGKGAFPVGDTKFKLDMSADVPGAAVQVDGRARALGIRAVQLTASAQPVSSGVTFDMKATPDATAGAAGAGTASTSAGAMRASGTLTQGGQFGAFGSVQASAIPTALIDPWLPDGLLVRPSLDLGPTVDELTVTVGSGDTPAIKIGLKSAALTLAAEGAQAADGSMSFSQATVVASGIRPELLKQLGVNVSSALRVDVRATDVRIPPSKSFNLATVAATINANVRPNAGESITLTVDGAPDAPPRTVVVKSVSIAADTRALGTLVKLDATVVADESTVHAVSGVTGLYTADGGLNWERAAYDATVRIAPVTANQLAREAPVLKEIAPTVFTGTFSVDIAYKGTLQDGQATALVDGGAAKAHVQAQLTASAATVTLDATVPVTRSVLGAAVGALPVVLGAPSSVHTVARNVVLPRKGLWEFGTPSEASVAVRVASLKFREVAGLASSVQLDGVELDAVVALAEPMSVRGTLKSAIAAIPAKGDAIRAADTDLTFSWSAGTGAVKQAWDTHLKLLNLNGAGIEELLDIPLDSRGQIGDSGTAHLKASQGVNGALAFEFDSKLDRIKASIIGDLTDGVLTLKPSEVDVNLPGPQALALLNGTKPEAERTWKKSDPLVMKAKVQSLRMRVAAREGDVAAKPAAVVAAPAGSPGVGAPPKAAAAAAAKMPTIQLPEGFSAVATVSLQPMTLTPVDGNPIRIEGSSFEVSAPGIGQPATVTGGAKLAAVGSGAGAGAGAGAGTGAGAPAAAEVVLNATLKDWTTPKGEVAFDTMQVNGRLTATRASTAVVGALLGMGTELTEALGPEVTADARVNSTGPGAGTVNASVDSQYLTLRAPRLTLKNGLLSVEADKPVRMDFMPSDPLRERLLEPINPIFTDVRMSTPEQRIVLTVPSVSYPLDGDYSKLDTDMELTVGPILMQRNSKNQLLNLLKVFQSQDGKPIEGQIDPLVVQVRAGQLTYQKFNVFLEKQGNTWVTQLIFSGDIDLTQTPAYARAIAANYPMSSIARQMISNVPAEDGGGELQGIFGMATGALNAVQLRISFSGALGEVDGKPMELKRKIRVDFKPAESAGEIIKGAGDVLKDIFGKPKK